MAFTPKDPHSSEFFAFDFAQLLSDGDSVSSISGLTIDVTDDVVTTLTAGTSSLNGDLVVCKLTGGTLGFTYVIRAEVITASGETLDLSANLLIRPQM